MRAHFKPMNKSLYYYVLILAFCFCPSWAKAVEALTEAQVVQLVLQQNLEVRSQYYDPKIAKTGETLAKSRFDTQIQGQASYQLDQKDVQIDVFGTDNRTILYEAQASKKIPYGVEAGVGLSNTRLSTNSPFITGDQAPSAGNPRVFETQVSFEARMNLLKNRFGKSDKAGLRLAKKQTDIALSSTYYNIENKVYEALVVYWRWIVAKRNLYVTQQFLRRAQEFLNLTQENKRIGLSEDPDVLAAQALVAERKISVLRAEDFLKDEEKRLRYFLDLPDSIVLKSPHKLHLKLPQTQRDELIHLALQNRKDYLVLAQQAEAKDIQISRAKDQKWPSLDLFSSLRLNSVDPGYGRALGETFSGQHPNWLVGAQFNLSFENRQAKSEMEKTQLEKAQLLLKIKNAENAIVLEVDEVLRELKLQDAEVHKYQQIVTLQKRKLDIENKNYQLGRSSSDIIVRFQEDYLAAEQRWLEAKLRLKLAEVDLRRVVSSLIPQNLEAKP